jgi:dTDP-4-amino-4,6-dideoxygalactose transaminase
VNFRLNEVLSAILRVQLGRLDGILEALRREKTLMREELDSVERFAFSPVHDEAGDCATTMALLFVSPDDASRFVGNMADEGVSLISPIDSGRHVYTNWSPILERRGAHHPGLDPFKRDNCRVEYSMDMCPRTLEYLARTVYIRTRADRDEKQLRELTATVKQVAEGGGA